MLANREGAPAVFDPGPPCTIFILESGETPKLARASAAGIFSAGPGSAGIGLSATRVCRSFPRVDFVTNWSGFGGSMAFLAILEACSG